VTGTQMLARIGIYRQDDSQEDQYDKDPQRVTSEGTCEQYWCWGWFYHCLFGVCLELFVLVALGVIMFP
jgi:hypothetical protein